MLDDLALFVSIVENGSLQAAAKRQQLPPATLTRRLQQLERELGCKLLHRSARRMLPTQEGWQYYERCRPLLASLAQATQALDASLNRIAGHVRVLAPVALASGVLQPAWGAFLTRHPEIDLELQLSNEREDLIGTGADLALRVGPQEDSLFTQRLLGRVPVLLVAAPDYLARRGVPQQPHDLAQHDLILADPLMSWQLIHTQTGQQLTYQHDKRPRLRINEVQLAATLACEGLGILYAPMTMVHQALEQGRVQQVLPQWSGVPREVYAVWPQQSSLPARTRALLDHLIDFAANHPLLMGAGRAYLDG